MASNEPRRPSPGDFPPGTLFFIKEFDVPLAWVPGRGWLNWFGGTPRAYDSSSLAPGNHWPATDFTEWLALVQPAR